MADGPQELTPKTDQFQESLEILENHVKNLQSHMMQHLAHCKKEAETAKEMEALSHTLCEEAKEEYEEALKFSEEAQAALDALKQSGSSRPDIGSLGGGRGKAKVQKARERLFSQTQERLSEALEEVKILKERYDAVCRLRRISERITKYSLERLAVEEVYGEGMFASDEGLSLNTTIYWNSRGNYQRELKIFSNHPINKVLREYCNQTDEDVSKVRFSRPVDDMTVTPWEIGWRPGQSFNIVASRAST